MKVHNISRRFRLGFFVFLVAFVICLSLSGTIRSRLSIAQSDKQITKQMMPQREISNLKHLTELLTSEGISLDERVLLPSRVNQSRTILARWKSADISSLEKPFTDDMTQEGLLSPLEIKSNKGALMRQRSFELSPTQILVVAVNQNDQALWWNLMPDPRLVRAETIDAAGNFSGKMIYRNSVEMLVSFPSDDAITELHFYHPNWNGQSYSLESIGNFSLSSVQK